MPTKEEIKQDAFDKAKELTLAEDKHTLYGSQALAAFARFIQQVSGKIEEFAEKADRPTMAMKVREHFKDYILVKEIDPDVLVVRKILHGYQRALPPPDSGWGNMSFEKGSYDNLPVFQAALKAYKESKNG